MLVRPRMKTVDVDGLGDLVISRSKSPFILDLGHESDVEVKVTNFNFIAACQRTRIGRFIYAMKFVWKHCK